MNIRSAKWLAASVNFGVAAAASLASIGIGCAANAADIAPSGRSIGYVFYDVKWGIYESNDGKEECPDGVAALGPREQYKLQFPDDGTTRTIVDTQLKRETDIWWPKSEPDQFEFRQASGKIAIGLNLDGKNKPTDFTSPEGKPGIDNELFRVIGCITNHRSPGSVLNFERTFFKSRDINQIMIELTDVDSLVNDDDVTITTYRGRDQLLNDATGNNFQPGGTQRVDNRWGKDFVHQGKGKIVNGVLISTKGQDFLIPHETAWQEAAYDWLRDARFELKLTPDRAEGVIGGYADVASFYYSRNRTWSTHHLSYGQQSQASMYRVLRKKADAYPDPVTGENTAISASLSVKLVQARILRSDPKLAENTSTQKITQFAEVDGPEKTR